MNDPVEDHVAATLDMCGVRYTRDPRKTERLDFYLIDFNVYIEVKQFHTDRIAEQMSRVRNVIAIQGMHSAITLRLMLQRGAIKS